jgi:hypothetical protein
VVIDEGEHVLRGRIDQGAAFKVARISCATGGVCAGAGVPQPAQLGRGIFGTRVRKSANPPCPDGRRRGKHPFCGAVNERKNLAYVLPCNCASSNVFRAALLSIVLTLAAGQNAALLCGTWCHSAAGMAGACEHQTQSVTPRLGANDDCVVNGNPVLFVGEDGRRSASAPNVAGAVAVVRFAFTPPAAGTLSRHEPNSRLLLELRPLVLALRI